MLIFDKINFKNGTMNFKNTFALVATIMMISFTIEANSQSIVKKNGGYDVTFNQNRSSEFTLDFDLDKYRLETVEKNGVAYTTIEFGKNIVLKKKGWAELPYMSASVQLPNNKNVSIEVVSEDYVEYLLEKPLLPSRGVIYRNQNPSEIPFEIDPASITSELYPSSLTEMSSPYIIRNVRGANIKVFPFRYNAAENTLRVYKKVTIKVVENNTRVINPLTNNNLVNKGIAPIYESLFVNYNQNAVRWSDELAQFGDILVIYTSRDASVIQPWITWKKQMGYNVHETQVATGTNVKTTIQNAYNANKNILYVQLVGDWADIVSDLGGSENTPMDPMLGCVEGTDDYHDIIIGRFSASTTAHVTTQGNKAINYEKNPDLAGTWYSDGLGIGSAEGSGIGDDSEIDYAHIDIIKENKLVPFTYSGSVSEAYGASVTSSQVSTPLNAGLGVINYCGHGAKTYWVTSNYSTTNAASASNGSELPIVFSVACVVGEFNTSGDCLAEALLRREGGGALASLMSTMNQPWTPPMRGQDYMNDILTQGYDYAANPGDGTSTTYGKTTFGAITFNATAMMVTESDASEDWDTYYTWTVFGDASVQVRTKTPDAITVSNLNVTPGVYSTQILVDGLPFEGALVSLYNDSEEQPSSAMTDASGNVSISHPYTGTVTLTVTGFNLATYSAEHTVAVSVAPICDFSGTPTTVIEGETVTFTDLSENYPSSWLWEFEGGIPATSTASHPTITYNSEGTYTVTLTVTNMAGEDSLTKVEYITVNPVTEAPVADFTASVTNIVMGGTVDFTDLSNNQPTSWAWIFEGGTPSSSTQQNPSGIIYTTPGVYAVTLYATNEFGTGIEEKPLYITVMLPDYCDASSASTSYEYISNVTISDINNTTAATSYTDYTATQEADVYVNQASVISVTLTGAYSSDQILIWVDWNKDGDFADLGETVYTSAVTGASGNYTYNTSITPPVGASLGTTRMRVRLHDTSYGPMAEPCGDSDYGEVEDYSLNVILVPTSAFSADVTAVCTNGQVQYTNSSSDATSYEWTFEGGTPATSTEENPIVTYSANGTFNVTLIATNSSSSDSEIKTDYITVTTPPSLTFVTNDASVYGASDGSIDMTIIGGTLPFSILWSNAESTEDISGLIAGAYDVEVVDNNGCIASNSATVNQPPLVVEKLIVNGISIYPNPANDFVNISAKNIEKVCLYNLLGQEIINKKVSDKSVKLDVGKLHKGLYIIKVYTSGNNVYSQKLTIK
ncbi:MAG TPA: hypothetical protein DDX39_05600 [Bacteroidales bacterium]|nr:MAG: hypothetical protein A2W98_06870 [Bacteroidetes bacterium GWF2_33_38]HBF88098.1 hypothetical protein [Bacteroidales bacterium]